MTSSTRIKGSPAKLHPAFDWRRIARTVLTSRLIDEIEETRLVPERKVLYQFSAGGHEVCQVLLGALLDQPRDGVSAYYRSRPLLLSIGLDIEEALAGPLTRSGGFSDGRDIGVVCNRPSEGGPTVIPMAGDVGSQYTPAAGWAQALRYRSEALGESDCDQAISVVLGGEGSVATNGFWSALTMATTLELPLLFGIEDNGYAISVPGDKQTPGADIAANLAAFKNLHLLNGDGSEPAEAAELLHQAVKHVRERRGPCLIRLTVPRLCGHSGQDTQTYKSPETLERERAGDPMGKLIRHLSPLFDRRQWARLKEEVAEEVEEALRSALKRPSPDATATRRYVFAERNPDGTVELQRQGGVAPEGHAFPKSNSRPEPEPTRLNMLTAIRRTLQFELRTNPKLLVFGEDVGPKGGVHAATMGLQKEFGEERVFDTSLSEEGIIGRAVGMALCGLVPVAEIQFRKYADPAAEQLNNCGTIRWRTSNRFAAPIIVRMPGGFFKCGDPWHSVSGEVLWAHLVGWRVCVPSNAQDAVGLLRTALRGNDPTIFFEHRYLLDSPWSRRPYPGDHFTLPLGKAHRLIEGRDLTLVSWGAMVERCQEAVLRSGRSVELLDLRTISPWDREAVLDSVRKTMRCLIVHEDTLTAGFGAEIAATVVRDAFLSLDAPVERLAVPDVPIPHNVDLMNSILPTVEDIEKKIVQLIEF